MDRRRRRRSSRKSSPPTEAHQEWRGRSEVHRGWPEEGRRRDESRGSGNLRQPGGASENTDRNQAERNTRRNTVPPQPGETLNHTTGVASRVEAIQTDATHGPTLGH